MDLVSFLVGATIGIWMGMAALLVVLALTQGRKGAR